MKNPMAQVMGFFIVSFGKDGCSCFWRRDPVDLLSTRRFVGVISHILRA